MSGLKDRNVNGRGVLARFLCLAAVGMGKFDIISPTGPRHRAKYYRFLSRGFKKVPVLYETRPATVIPIRQGDARSVRLVRGRRAADEADKIGF
ncbi:MAG: hypothetical protein N2111_06065 [Candidatus Sumerlaeaceae bacterium]|nr:hypothetical protein [Candidatus Sumerlaeaceae bacterium]